MEHLEYQIVNGKKFNSKLLYTLQEKQLYKIKTKSVKKNYYVCFNKNCKARIELFADGLCVKPKGNKSEHNHADQEEKFKEINSLNGIRQDCLTAARVLGEVNALSGIRTAFKRGCEK